jgi:hypothetical protein
LSTLTPGASIYFTLDGSEPTLSSFKYGTPFNLFETVPIRARAFKDGMPPSVITDSFLENNIVNRSGFLRWDPVTRGSWIGKYGSEGFVIPQGGTKLPSNIEISGKSLTTWIWNEVTDDQRALPPQADAQTRRASAWYSADGLILDVGIYDDQSHAIALYFLDWDNSRIQLVEVIDAIGRIVQSYTLENFSGGTYLVLSVQGRFTIKITAKKGNAVLSGVFVDAAPDELSNPPTGAFLVPGRVANNSFPFIVRGQSGTRYILEYTTDLETWRSLGESTMSSDTVNVQWPGASEPRRYFRVRYVP